MHEPAARKYHIKGILGRGGCGTVYAAELTSPGGFSRDVALKVLNGADEDEDVAKRLRDEARLLGLLNHRAIVRVDSLVRLSGRWAIVMEAIDGIDLDGLIAKSPVPAGTAAEIVAEVARALDAAVSTKNNEGKPLGFTHRDLKPTNILLTARGEVKVVDFGVSRSEFGRREAQTLAVTYGSPGYVAPERYEMVDGPEGDIYGLGVVFYELLSGVRFGDPDLRSHKHAELIARRLQSLPGHTTRPVRQLLSLMLHFEPDERPSAREVERLCQEITSQQQDAYLRDFAEEQVPLVAKGRLSDGDEFVGQTLQEEAAPLLDPNTTFRDGDEDDEPVVAPLAERLAPDFASFASKPKPSMAPTALMQWTMPSISEQPRKAPSHFRQFLLASIVLLSLAFAVSFLTIATGALLWLLTSG